MLTNFNSKEIENIKPQLSNQCYHIPIPSQTLPLVRYQKYTFDHARIIFPVHVNDARTLNQYYYYTTFFIQKSPS
jgi:hypothetical protein